MFVVFCKPILAMLLQRKHQTIINASRMFVVFCKPIRRDLPTCGEGGRTEMPEPPHQDGAAGAAERPPRGTAPGDSACNIVTKKTSDDHQCIAHVGRVL